MTIPQRDRAQHITIARHVKTGFYFMQVSILQTINLDGLCKKINDISALSPKRLIVNYPIKDFADQHSPVVAADWKVSKLDGTFTNYASALIAGAEFVRAGLGSEFLLTAQIVPREEWLAFEPAKEAVIRRQYAKIQKGIVPEGPMTSVVWFADSNRAKMETYDPVSLQGAQNVLFLASVGSRFTLLTPNLEEQFKKCTKDKKVVTVSLYLDLVVTNHLRGCSGNVIKSIKFMHFASSFLTAVTELHELIKEIMVKHKDAVVYEHYQG